MKNEALYTNVTQSHRINYHLTRQSKYRGTSFGQVIFVVNVFVDYLVNIGKIEEILFVKTQEIHIINNSLSSKNPPSKVGWYFCEFLLGGGAVDDFSILKKMILWFLVQILVTPKVECINFSKMMETLGRSGSWWKTSSFLF